MKRNEFFIVLLLVGVFCYTACENNSAPPPAARGESILVSEVAINREDFSLKVGLAKQLQVAVSPADADDRSLEYFSNDAAIAGVDETGMVTANAVGEAYITAAAKDGSGVMDTVKFTISRADANDPAVLWDWRYGDGFESGTEVRGKYALVNATGNVELNEQGWLVISNNGGFTVGTMDAAPTSSTYMPDDGAFDLARKTKIRVTYMSSAGVFTIFVNNNTPSRGNSVLGNNSRIFNRAPVSGVIEALIDPQYMGTNTASLAKAFLQFSSSASGNTAGAIAITGITITYEEGGSVSPEDAVVQSIAITGGDFSLAAGESRQLQCTVLPETALDKSLLWRSSNTAVAAVSSGNVLALGPGSAEITATAQDGSGVSAKVTVTVSGPALNTKNVAQDIFSRLKGQPVTTFGWADRANNGAGLRYTNPGAVTLICDEDYPSASEKLIAFKNALAITGDSFIIVSGDIDLSDGKVSDYDHSYFDEFNTMTHARAHGDITLNLTSNTTLIGINKARIKYGGIRINNLKDVIIRNVVFYDAHGSTEYDTTAVGYTDSKASIDGLVIQGSSDGVWVDHCGFTDGACEDLTRNYNHDGALDIPAGKNVTVSWCEFTNHDKVMLVAGNDSLTDPLGRQITLHHNWFHDKVTQRMPRCRGTQMHIYNNFFDNIGVPSNNGYSLGPGIGSMFIVENNNFGEHTALGGKGIVKYFDLSDASAATFSKFYQSGNNITLTNEHCGYDGVDKLRNFSAHLVTEKPWDIPYNYTLEDAAGLVSSIPAGAGNRLVL